MKRLRQRRVLLSTVAVAAALSLAACGSKTDEQTTTAGAATADTSGDTVKVGLLNSLSGTMSISEVTVNKSLHMAIDEINAAGGVLGKKLQPVDEDGASDWPTFAEKAQKLISEDKVAAVFGGWTSASRKAMLPVFEKNKALLFYPVQYEGLEASPYIYYSGATTNQQIIPGLDYLKSKGLTKIFLVGSDYVFPRTANKEIKAYAAANGMTITGEEYLPLGNTEVGTILNKVKSSGAQAVFNTLNGDSNVAFFKQAKAAGITADKTPIMSVSVAEEEVNAIGTEYLEGHLTAWNYYQTLENPENEKFVAAFKAKYGDDSVTSDPMEAAYVSVYIWKALVEKANSFAVEDVNTAAKAGGITYQAPEGLVTLDGENHHLYKTGRIGVINGEGLIDEVWNSGEPIKPDPFLTTYDWAKGLS